MLVVVLGTVGAILSALEMRDRARLVDIIALFASGAGTGAGLAVALRGRPRGIGRAAN